MCCPREWVGVDVGDDVGVAGPKPGQDALSAVSGEELPQAVVEEDAVGVELATDGEETVVFRVLLLYPLAGQEMQLAPVVSSVELGEEDIDIA